jgi:hypothetical protein
MKKIIPVALGVSALLLGGLHNYKKAVERSDKSFLDQDPAMPSDTVTLDADKMTGAHWFEAVGAQDISLVSFDGLKLHALYIPAEEESNRFALIAHGYSGKGRNMISVAKLYRDKLHCNILLPDARGHGQSEGDYIGFGWHDHFDQLMWLQYILLSHPKTSKIVLHGVSMGASTVLMTSGARALPEQVAAVVSDCAYTSAQAELAYQMKRLYHIPAFPLLQATDFWTRVKAGYSFKEASALEQVKKSHVPTLFIHGDEDAFVPYEMVHELYNACPAPKDLYIVPGAGHGNAYRIAGAAYEKSVLDFVGPLL